MARLVAGGARYSEVPYRTVPRQHGKSKTAPNLLTFGRLGFKYLRALVAARRTIRG